MQHLNKIYNKYGAFNSLLGIGLFLLPFFYWPISKVVYEVPKVTLFWIWTDMLAIITLSTVTKIGRQRMNINIMLIIIIFFASVIISSLLGVDKSKSLWGNYFRNDGLITLLHLVLFTFVTGYCWQDKLQKSIVWAIGSSGVTLSILTVLQYARYFMFHESALSGWQGIQALSFGNPNFLAGYLSVIVPFVFIFVNTNSINVVKKNRIYFFLVYFLAIGLTRSWGGILTLFLFIIIYLLSTNNKFLISVTGLFIFAAIAIIYTKSHTNNQFAAESRPRIVTKILLGTAQRPIWGYGWANVNYAFNKVDWPIHFNDDVNVDKAHSSLLEVLATAGVIGLSIYIALILSVIRTLFHQYKNHKTPFNMAILISFLLYFVHSQTNVISINEELIFWLVTAFCIHSSHQS